MIKAPAMKSYDIVIPARYQSTRLPGKPLRDICGKTMIRRVVESAQSSSAERVFVATDDEQIADEVLKTTSAGVCETAASHANGTDRISEAVSKLKLRDDRVVVNVQGDEPLMRGSLIDAVVTALRSSDLAQVATAARSFKSANEWRDATKVKCVVDRAGHAIYFSRAAVPWQASDELSALSLHHIGIYAYTAGYLKMHSGRQHCSLEKKENLEQLRVLYYGDRIAVHIENDYIGFGVDTEEDLARARTIFAKQHD